MTYRFFRLLRRRGKKEIGLEKGFGNFWPPRVISALGTHIIHGQPVWVCSELPLPEQGHSTFPPQTGIGTSLPQHLLGE